MAEHDDVPLVGEAEQRLERHGRCLEGRAVVAIDIVAKRRQPGRLAAHQGRREPLGQVLHRHRAGEALERLVPRDAVVAMDRKAERQQAGKEQEDGPARSAPHAVAYASVAR